jgi:predicted neuraminidase
MNRSHVKPLLSSMFLLLDPLLPAADPAIVSAGFIYEPGPYPQIHASTIVETPDGLVAAWFGGTAEQHPDVGIWVSRQVGGKWTPGVAAADGIQHTRSDGKIIRHPTWNPVLFQPREGPLMLFYKVGPDPRRWWGMLTTSADHGRSWDPPRRLPEGILGPVKNKPVQLADGRILCPTSEEFPARSADEKETWSVHFEVTRDLGRTWERTPPLHDGREIQAIQPSILFPEKGNADHLLALGRTRQDRIFEIRSTDGGRTWGEMTLGRLPNNNSGTDAVTLADGTHLIVYNHIGGTPGKWGGKRSPLNLAASRDGSTWQAALVLESDPGEFSYPAIIQSRDGRVHLTYTWNRTKVKHVVIDPARLTLRPIEDGKWPD